MIDFEGFLFGLFVVALLVVGECVLSDVSCSAKAGAMRKKYSYSIITGCMIEAKTGEWVDIKAYRVVE